MSAGTGVRHSEAHYLPDRPSPRLLRISILPDRKGRQPRPMNRQRTRKLKNEADLA